MEKTLVSFKSGEKISDYLTAEFLEKCVQKWREGHSHWACSTGDTCVSFHQWSSSIDFIVANSDGVSRTTVYADEYAKLNIGAISFDRNFR